MELNFETPDCIKVPVTEACDMWLRMIVRLELWQEAAASKCTQLGIAKKMSSDPLKFRLCGVLLYIMVWE